MSRSSAETTVWPELPLEEWQDTYKTLHMWMQVVGKVRLELTPYVNHSWDIPFYLTSRGLTTSPIPYHERTFDIDFDFFDHKLLINTSDGTRRTVDLYPRSVADFYAEVMSALKALGIDVEIWTMPVEIPDPIRFTEDHEHASYDAEYVSRWWQALLQTDRVLKQFRGRFIGKCSPVHFFWGAFDLAVTRFSGRRAPQRSDPYEFMREAYSHEVNSAGFWPGSGPIRGAAFYCYHTPEPAGFAEAAIRPETAFYSQDFGEYILMYDDVRTSSTPDAMLLDFFQTTYEAGATLARWDRANLERDGSVA